MSEKTLSARIIEGLVLAILVGACLYVSGTVYEFSQGRFFTIDEFQYGHATWLVANGAIPYVDFFEHHFPGSYVLHAPLFLAAWDAETGALLLRKIVFAYWLAVSLLAGLACFGLTRDRFAALLVALLPITFGFSLMSAVDYRADNFGAVFFLACLVLLERNRRVRRPSLAIVCGVLATVAALMTQKMAFVAGGSLLVFLACDGAGRIPFLRRLRSLQRPRSPAARPFIACPTAFVVSAVAVGLLFLAIAGSFGMLARGFESTIVQAAEHERFYESFSLFEKGYVTRFWQETWLSTAAIVFFAGLFFTTEAGLLWVVPVALSIIGGTLMVAPYPYNFVFLCWVVAMAGVRGFVAVIGWLRERAPALMTAMPLLYLLPLAALGAQLGFVEGSTTNAHQIKLLKKIEEHGGREDAVIDNQGGAMFNPHASYYFHHGSAHRKMFAEYMREDLASDYRESRALFWIRDTRFKALPNRPKRYLTRNYVHGGEGLYALGIRTPETGTEARLLLFDAIRSTDYWFHRVGRTGAEPISDFALSSIRVDGHFVAANPLPMREGIHQIEIPPDSPGYIVTPVEATFFDPNPGPAHFVKLFEYRRDRNRPRTQMHFAFAKHLATAENRSVHEHAGDARLATIGPDDTLEQRPGSLLRYTLVVPEEPRLRGHVRLRGPLGQDALKDGSLVLEIRSEAQSETLVAELLVDLRNANLQIDRSLAAYAGEKVELSFVFRAPEDSTHRRRLIWTGLRIEGAEGAEGAENAEPAVPGSGS